MIWNYWSELVQLYSIIKASSVLFIQKAKQALGIQTYQLLSQTEKGVPEGSPKDPDQ